MLRRLGIGFVAAIVGYIAGAVLGYFLVEGLSSNAHDRSVEAAMTGAFAVGPLFGLIGFIAGFVRGGKRTSTTNLAEGS